jgi:hypothetical protein
LAAEPEASAWTGRGFETLFICFPDKSAGGPGGVKTVLIVVDRRRQKRAQFSVFGVSVDR